MSDPTALLLVDVVNPLDFEGGERLLPRALAAADRLEPLIDRFRDAGRPVIYANDNFGHWREDFDTLVERATAEDSLGAPLVRRLRPRDGDFFVLKPRHSAFYDTPLDHLLDHELGVERLVIAGFVTEQCVLLTAADAHMRGYEVVVPADCSASETDERHRWAVEWMERVADADVRPAGADGRRPSQPARS